MNTVDCGRLRRLFDRHGRGGVVEVAELSKIMGGVGAVISDSQLRELIAQAGGADATEMDWEGFLQLLVVWRDAAKLKLFEDSSTTDRKMREALAARLLLSDSWARFAFDTAVLAVGVAYFALTLLADAIEMSWTVLFSIQLITTVAFVADLGISAGTYRGTDSLRAAIATYSKAWLIPDLLCAFPWGFIPGQWGTTLRHVPFIKLLKSKELWRHSGRVPMSGAYISLHYKVLPMTLLAVAFALMVHGFTVGFMLVKQSRSSAAGLVGGEFPYSTAVYFVIYTLGTVGFGNVEIETENEKLYCCLVLCGSILTNGFIVGKLVAIMQAADLQKDRVGKLRQTLAVLEHFDLPHALQDEVLQFQDHLLGHALGGSYTTTLGGLPDEMHTNMNVVSKLQLLSLTPPLDTLHAVVQVAIVQALSNTVAVPEQYVLGVGEEIRAVQFIAHGFADVLAAEGSRVATLSKHQSFGRAAMIGPAVSTVAVKALGYCDLFALTRADIVALRGRFRGFRSALAEIADAYAKFDSEPLGPTEAAPLRQKTVTLDAREQRDLQGGGELEDASQVQSITRRRERIKSLADRLASAKLRLHNASVPSL